MKNIISIKILFVIVLSNFLCGQDPFTLNDVELTTGDREFEQGREIQYGISRTIDNIRDAGISKLIEKQTIDQTVLNNWISGRRAKEKMDHGNYKQHLDYKLQKLAWEKEYRKKAREASLYHSLSEAWETSRTGKNDGRMWEYLSDAEREMYTLRYHKFHNAALREEKEEDSNTKLKISQSEYAHAWKIRNLGNASAEDWDNLPVTSKNKFRKSFYDYKLAQLIRQTPISEQEYAVAWGIAQIGSGNLVSWHEMNDPSIKEVFRKNYKSLKVHSGRGLPTNFIQEENEPDTLLAISNTANHMGR